jgi:hypothetical protein
LPMATPRSQPLPVPLKASGTSSLAFSFTAIYWPLEHLIVPLPRDSL